LKLNQKCIDFGTAADKTQSQGVILLTLVIVGTKCLCAFKCACAKCILFNEFIGNTKALAATK